MNKATSILIVSAHAADYVWRSGGTIAKHIKNNVNVSVVVLSLGIRGESNDLWKGESQTKENIEMIRNRETNNAAEILGIQDLELWNLSDYPIDFSNKIPH